MPWLVSSSGPLAPLASVLLVTALVGCVQRRADGRRGNDATDDVASIASTGSRVDTSRKVDTGTVMAGQPPIAPVPITPVPPSAAAPLSTIDSPHSGLDTAVTRSATPAVTQSDLTMLEQRHPMIPISGIPAARLPDTFNELRGGTRKHEALDILAPRGTPVHSADDGTVIKLFTSKAGGLTVYVTGPAQRFVYYYAHLDSYATGLAERQTVHKGDVLGYVGTSGNADPNVPHLHFGIARTDNIKEWWTGEPINPTTVLRAAAEP